MTVNTVEYEAAMQRLRAGVRRGIVDPQFGTLTVQGRLLAERCQEFTPPRNVGQGKAAVARDMSVMYRPLSHTTFRNKGLQKIVRTDNRAEWDRVAQRFGDSHKLKNTKAMGFNQAWHAQNRISRGRGRTSRKGNLGVVTLGAEGRQARGFIKQVQGFVGWAKAGWNQGILGLGGIVKGAWISRHGMGHGGLTDGRSAADPWLRVLNASGWARYGGEGEANRIMRNAISARARDMQAYFEKAMQRAADGAQQFGRKAA